MPVSCSVIGCRNIFKTGGNIQFFGFPLKNEELTKQWMQALKRKNFTPSKASKVCSDHFIESDNPFISDYLIRPGAYVKHLKPGAVPSVFSSIKTSKRRKKVNDAKAPSSSTVWIKEEPPDVDSNSPIPSINFVEVLMEDNDLPRKNIKAAPSITYSTQISQTDMSMTQVSARIETLEKKIRVYQQKLRRRDDKITKLTDVIKAFQKDGEWGDEADLLISQKYDSD